MGKSMVFAETTEQESSSSSSSYFTPMFGLYDNYPPAG